MKIKSKLFFLILPLLSLSLSLLNGQPLTKTTENVVAIPELKRAGFIGRINTNPIFYTAEDRFIPDYEFFILFEINEGIRSYDYEFNSPIAESDLETGFLDLNNHFNGVSIYTVGYSDDDTYEIYYQNLWLQYKGKDYLLDSIYNADKLIHSSFSSDGRYLLVNTLNTLSDYYNPDQDNRIMVYELSQLDEGIIDKQYVPCPQCADSYLIGDSLFFTIGRKDGYDGWSNKDIYVAPWGSLQDSVKIASTTDLKGVSPDGKYILGSRFFDLQQPTAVMIDVDSKKYQLLLGRNYAEKRAFYSFEEEKFVFDFREHFIYVDYPKTYPFDALNWRNEEIPDWTNEEFWKQYVHDTLPNEN